MTQEQQNELILWGATAATVHMLAENIKALDNHPREDFQKIRVSLDAALDDAMTALKTHRDEIKAVCSE